MPKLIKLYIVNVAIGFALAGLFVGMLLWFNIANLWHLVSTSDKGLLAVCCLVDFQWCYLRWRTVWDCCHADER